MKIHLGLLLLAFFWLPELQAQSIKPNIVLIFVDDMGYGDLGSYGNQQNKTPHLDRLAAAGQRWTNFYSSGSTCVPSRKGLMSGRHPNYIPRVVHGLDGEQGVLLPAMLKQQGYATAILGKWHLAGYPQDYPSSPMHPLQCGFDYYYGTPGSNDVPAPLGKKQTRAVFDACDKFTFQVPLYRNRELIELPANQELFTQRYTAEAVKWIHEHKDDNFFLYLAHNMPHAPIFASSDFQGRSKGGRFGDVVEEIDWSVGEVVKAIREAGIEKETLIVFTSDNGPWSVFGPHAGTAAPLRGEKATTWEGGLRVPTIFYWPDRIQPAVVDGIAANLDLYATFATLAGGTVPEEKPGFVSKDLTKTLLKGAPSPRTWWVYHQSAYRSGRYKIHTRTIPPTDPIERKRKRATEHATPLLFDLENDPAEQNNIAAKHPEIVQRLLEEMTNFQQHGEGN